MKPAETTYRRYIYSLIAAEIAGVARYADKLVQWLPTPNDDLTLLRMMDNPDKSVLSGDEFEDLSGERDARTVVLLNGSINHHYDIQGLLLHLQPRLSRGSRVVIVGYNPYVGPLYRLANRLRLRRGELPTTFVTRTDLENLAKIAGFSIVRTRLAAYVPWRMFGLGDLLNRLLPHIPLVRWLAFSYVAVLRPVSPGADNEPSLSCVIPARNERGNIENAVKRLKDFPCELEIIFVEGNSSDGTWEEILRVREKYKEMKIRSFQQTGKGKADAVRLGFSHAQNDLLTILDADLTMPPEMLHRFYRAYCAGYGDFVNGSRLVYPMEGEAMRTLNRLGNVFFAKALSWVLGVKLGDSLCGTKLMTRRDYERMIRWRRDFGDFDPFGDFELLFPAAVMGLGIVEVPVRYLDRTYGSTNISRFSHGLMLLRMTLIGLFRIKFGGRIGRA